MPRAAVGPHAASAPPPPARISTGLAALFPDVRLVFPLGGTSAAAQRSHSPLGSCARNGSGVRRPPFPPPFPCSLLPNRSLSPNLRGLRLSTQLSKESGPQANGHMRYVGPSPTGVPDATSRAGSGGGLPHAKALPSSLVPLGRCMQWRGVMPSRGSPGSDGAQVRRLAAVPPLRSGRANGGDGRGKRGPRSYTPRRLRRRVFSAWSANAWR